MQKLEGQYPKQSSADRKECLYHDIIDYFDKGKVRKLFNDDYAVRTTIVTIPP